MSVSCTQTLTRSVFLAQLPRVLGGVCIALPVLYYRYAFSLYFFIGLVLSVFLLLVGLLDYQYGLIFDRLLIPMFALGIVRQVMFPNDTWAAVGGGILIGAGTLLVLRILSQGGMGWGDIKFAGSLGIWLGCPTIIIMLLVSFILGGLYAAVLLLLHRADRKTQIPFGPFLSIGAFTAFTYGSSLVDLDWIWS